MSIKLSNNDLEIQDLSNTLIADQKLDNFTTMETYSYVIVAKILKR